MAGCLTPASGFGSHISFLEVYLVHICARQKRMEKASEVMPALCKVTGSLWPCFFTGTTARNLQGPQPSSLWSCHTGSGCTFIHDWGTGELSLPPPDTIPTCCPLLGVSPALLDQVSPSGRDPHICHCPGGGRANCSLVRYLHENLRSKEKQGSLLIF